MDTHSHVDVRKFASSVLAIVGQSNLTHKELLRQLALALAEAGSVDGLTLVLEQHGKLVAIDRMKGRVVGKLPSLQGAPVSSIPTEPTGVGLETQGNALVASLRAAGFETFTIVPLRAGGGAVGLLVLEHRGELSPSDSSVLQLIGTYLGSKLELERACHHVRNKDARIRAQERQDHAIGDEALAAIARIGQLASLGTLAGGLIHEVNNPTTFIALAGGQIEKFVERVKDGLDGEEAQPVLDLTHGITESTQQIRDLVAAFRLLVGATNQSMVVTVDLERVLKAAVELTRAAHRHDAPLETDFEQMPPCSGHYVELGPVVINVLVNAIESLRSSSGKMVRVEGRVRDHTIQVRIQDTGEGIHKDILPRVFEPFFSTRDRERHAGLGLTIARQMLLNLAGTISIDSEVGKGTSVCIHVPVRQPCGKQG